MQFTRRTLIATACATVVSLGFMGKAEAKIVDTETALQDVVIGISQRTHWLWPLP